MATVKCVRCGKKFQASRSTARYCSDSCRVQFNHHGGTLLGDQYKTAATAISNIIELLDSDNEHWGHEAHHVAMALNEILCQLYARTDFLGPSHLKNDRWKLKKS